MPNCTKNSFGKSEKSWPPKIDGVKIFIYLLEHFKLLQTNTLSRWRTVAENLTEMKSFRKL